MDGTGKIRYTEFLAATIEAHGAISEERLAEAFDRIDADDSGYISKENLREMLGNEIAQEEIDAIMSESDITRDGKISYAEFLAQWEDQHEQLREEMMGEVEQLRASVRSVTSDLSGSVEDMDIVSRANFIDQKLSADRRGPVATDHDAVEEFKNLTTSETTGGVEAQNSTQAGDV